MLTSETFCQDARDPMQRTALHSAAKAGNLVAVKLLITRQAQVNLKDSWNKARSHLFCPDLRTRIPLHPSTSFFLSSTHTDISTYPKDELLIHRPDAT